MVLHQPSPALCTLSVVVHISLADILDGEIVEPTYMRIASEDDSAEGENFEDEAVLLAAVTATLDPPVPPPSPILEIPLNKTVWWVGTEYPYLPGPLSPIAHSKSRKWFVVTHGTRVGVFLDIHSVITCTQGYSGAKVMMRKHQHKAIKNFNRALERHDVSIISPSMPRFLFSPLMLYDMQTDSDDENVLYLDANDFSDVHAVSNSRSGNSNTVSLTEDPEDVDDVEIATLIASFRLSNGDLTSAPASSSSQAVVASTAGSVTLVNESVRSLEQHFVSIDINDIESPRDKTGYKIGSGNQVQKDWALAAKQAKQNGETVRAVKKRRKRRPPRGYGAYVVFVGVTPGVYLTWAECKAQAFGQPSNVYSGYMTLELAEAAFQYALDKGWVRYANVDQPCALPSQVPFDPNHSTTPEDYDTPLNAGKPFERWYVVYRGISPGIYKSDLERSINTTGISDCLTESFESLALIHRKFRDALRDGVVQVLTG
ncbi:uncharacterized protein ARMOST_02675 [Armillaria ostoyae]|uniref:Ribonuclease H1 N-terminal domain-containing protein n=1 Tax=Armillaria ostoyae TaxID=47428 RepID=A0A284QSC5_ARMOS|nr:uncharacterized protein ARMOST_02675 [Armillaria ostoyae]